MQQKNITDELKTIRQIIKTLNDAQNHLEDNDESIQNHAKKLIYLQPVIMSNYYRAVLSARVNQVAEPEADDEVRKWKLLSKVFNCSWHIKNNLNSLTDQDRANIIEILAPHCKAFSLAKRRSKIRKNMIIPTLLVKQQRLSYNAIQCDYSPLQQTSYVHSLGY